MTNYSLVTLRVQRGYPLSLLIAYRTALDSLQLYVQSVKDASRHGQAHIRHAPFYALLLQLDSRFYSPFAAVGYGVQQPQFGAGFLSPPSNT